MLGNALIGNFQEHFKVSPANAKPSCQSIGTISFQLIAW